MKYFTGTDIGSTASGVVVLDREAIVTSFVPPTGWSSKEAARSIAARLTAEGCPVGVNMQELFALSEVLGVPVRSGPMERYAGALGAARIARGKGPKS